MSDARLVPAFVPALVPAPSLAAPSAAAASPAELAARIARIAALALIEEARLTPKPALVDGRGNGAHRDLDLATMIRSAQALEATFHALARVAFDRAPSPILHAELARIGRAGEAVMMRATGGANTHRGAIWSIGLLVAGASMCAGAPPLYADAARICDVAAHIARFHELVAVTRMRSMSHGERARRRYDIGGAPREAALGFPHVIGVGLPSLVAARARRVAENEARIDALLAIMTSLDDTCLLHRAGVRGLRVAKDGARRVLDLGGSATPEGRDALLALDRDLIALHASPGGAADLLAATLFLDMLTGTEPVEGQRAWRR